LRQLVVCFFMSLFSLPVSRFFCSFSFSYHLPHPSLHSFPTRRSSDLFLRISPDARSGAMGDVGIAISADANAQYWNIAFASALRSEEHTSELQSPYDLVCRLLLEKKKKKQLQE